MHGEDGDGPGSEDGDEIRGEGRLGVAGESLRNAHLEIDCVVEKAEIDSGQAEERIDVEEEDAVKEGDMRIRHHGRGNEASWM